jgi:hypothetical protein
MPDAASILTSLANNAQSFFTVWFAQSTQAAQSLISQNKNSKGGIALFRTHEHPRDQATAKAYTTHNHARLKAWAKYLTGQARDLTEAENVMTLFMAVHAFGILKRAEPYLDRQMLQDYGFDFGDCLSTFLSNADDATWYHLFYVFDADRERLKRFLAHHSFKGAVQEKVVAVLG